MSIDKPSTSSGKRLGIIAGQGKLPGAIASEAKKMGYSVTAILLRPFADESIKEYTDSFYEIPIGRFGKIVKFLKQSSISEIVMAGKVPKGILFQDKKSLMPDLRAIRFLLSLKDYSDTTVLQAISNELKNDGIKVLKTTTFTKDLLTTEGVLTKRHPQKNQYRDIRFGWRIAKEIGMLDIGQTIVVKDMAVMAVEAMEGTDEAILRGGRLAKKDSVVIKVSKPHQDLRFDVPVVGIHTLSTMKRANASLLVLEAEKSIILEKEKFIKEADKAGIIVVGVR